MAAFGNQWTSLLLSAILSASLMSCRSPDFITIRNEANGFRWRNWRTTSTMSSHQIIILFTHRPLLLLQLDIQSQPADLVAEHVERNRRAGFQRVGAFHHAFVD